jgi:hypothetical protein
MHETVDELDGMNFVFLCMEGGDKAVLVEHLERASVPFVDVGMGLSAGEAGISGIVRTTTSIPERRDILRRRVSLGPPDSANEYDANIQVADLNALNAALAVIRWKKFYGFYVDYEGELDCTYTVDTNMVLNDR